MKREKTPSTNVEPLLQTAPHIRRANPPRYAGLAVLTPPKNTPPRYHHAGGSHAKTIRLISTARNFHPRPLSARKARATHQSPAHIKQRFLLTARAIGFLRRRKQQRLLRQHYHQGYRCYPTTTRAMQQRWCAESIGFYPGSHRRWARIDDDRLLRHSARCARSADVCGTAAVNCLHTNSVIERYEQLFSRCPPPKRLSSYALSSPRYKLGDAR